MAPCHLRTLMIDEEQKKIFTSSDVLYSSENVGEKQSKGIHVFRSALYCIPVLGTVLFFRGTLTPHLIT